MLILIAGFNSSKYCMNNIAPNSPALQRPSTKQGSWVKRTLPILLVAGLSALIPAPRAHGAVSSIGIANYLPIKSAHVKDGDIVDADSSGYYLSATAYDPNVYGIVTEHPAVMIQATSQAGYPVINTGTAYVLVIGANGPIKKGDMIATSGIPGLGMKAVSSGFVIGQALSSVTFANSHDAEEIPVMLNLHYLPMGSQSTSAPLSIDNALRLTQNAAEQQPLRVVQYIMAVLVLTLSFAFGFLIFIRFINTGIQAIGRNPLASKTIQVSILFNVLIVIAILMSGVILAYFMIRL